MRNYIPEYGDYRVVKEACGIGRAELNRAAAGGEISCYDAACRGGGKTRLFKIQHVVSWMDAHSFRLREAGEAVATVAAFAFVVVLFALFIFATPSQMSAEADWAAMEMEAVR